MKLEYTPAQEALRAEARAWLEAHAPKEPLPSYEGSREGFDAHCRWEHTLAEDRWSVVTWPAEYGGRGLSLVEWLIFEEEYFRAAAPGRVSQNGIFLLAPTLMEYGTPEQKARFLPPMACADEVWAQAWSEPQAGSDLAAVRSTATRDGDDYVLNGQKIWSSRAPFADWAFGLFRAPGSSRHQGMSLIFFPLGAPGVKVRPIERMDGKKSFAEIFLDEVRVPAFNRLGDEGQGWEVCMSTAGFERGLLLRSPARYQSSAKRLARLYAERGQGLGQGVRDAVVQHWMDAEAYALSVYQTASRLDAGGKIGPESSTNKIFWSELDLGMQRTALEILGPLGELAEHGDPLLDGWVEDYVFAIAGRIYAGSNEIQRNIIAERMLGLPRR
jgi:alkylation response protein AidB-like acyl-CoA dehydrogenase